MNDLIAKKVPMPGETHINKTSAATTIKVRQMRKRNEAMQRAYHLKWNSQPDVGTSNCRIYYVWFEFFVWRFQSPLMLRCYESSNALSAGSFQPCNRFPIASSRHSYILFTLCAVLYDAKIILIRFRRISVSLHCLERAHSIFPGHFRTSHKAIQKFQGIIHNEMISSGLPYWIRCDTNGCHLNC